MKDTFRKAWIVKPVPDRVVARTRYNYNHHRMDLADSFEDAVRSCPECGEELKKAAYLNDFRAFIPSAYLEEYLDFGKYPLYQTI